jgi:hypothetical protein
MFITQAHSFFNPIGMMRGMMGQGQNIMLAMCGSPMGNMGAGMWNQMGGMMGSVPGFGGMMNGMRRGMTVEASWAILSDKQTTMKALECAKRNPKVVPMMIEVSESDSRILYHVADLMVKDRDFAFSLIDFVNISPMGAQYLLSKVDSKLVAKLIEAVEVHEGLAYPVLKFVTTYRNLAIKAKAPMMNALTRWGDPEVDFDGEEKTFLKMMKVTFKKFKSVQQFFGLVEKLEPKDQQDLFNTMFLGKVYSFDQGIRAWGEEVHTRQAYFNLYQMMISFSAFIQEDETQNQELAQFIGKMMTYFFTPEGQLNPWGQQFIQAMVDGAMYHRNPEIGKLAQFMLKLMPPDMGANLPQPNPESPAPYLD